MNRDANPEAQQESQNERLALRIQKNDFGNPDGVRITNMAPWQIAPILGEPGDQVRSEAGMGAHREIESASEREGKRNLSQNRSALSGRGRALPR